jgi:4-hydroxy-2-oxoheptanedioate aldolase
MHEAVIAIAREGVSPVVRIAANEAWMVKRESLIKSSS